MASNKVNENNPNLRPQDIEEKIRIRKARDAQQAADRAATKIFGRNKESLRNLLVQLSSGIDPTHLPQTLADVGSAFNAEQTFKAISGSNVLAQSQLVALITLLKTFIITKEDAIELTPHICKAIDTLTKLNKMAVDVRVDIANANTGLKAVTGKMFIPTETSFQPREIVIAEDVAEHHQPPQPVANE